ncbi:AAA family ATPase, partial [bacterium]|nr:AAA family ATPase [bacterium]
MLKKVISIANLGKFRNYSATGDVEFKKMTLIYADNGQGKTTIGSMLRSLSENNPQSVIGRKTLGQQRDVTINLRFETQNVTFQNNLWSEHKPYIQVFDTKFIQENIYIGNQVDIENKRSLYKLVVGTTGVQLAKKVDELDNTIRELNSEITKIEKELKRSIKGNVSIEKFVALPVPDIEKMKKDIEKLESDLRAAKKADEIKSKSSLTRFDIVALDLDTIKQHILANLTDLSKDAIEAVNAKMKSLGPQSQDWLSKGVIFTQNSSCPYCESSTVGNKLVEAYIAFFSQNYQKIQLALNKIKKELSQDFASKIQENFVKNNLQINYWGEFFEIHWLHGGNQLNAETGIAKISSVLKDLVAARESDWQLDLSQDSRWASLEDDLSYFASNIKLLNDEVDAHNKKIEDYKRNLSTSNIRTIEQSITELQDHLLKTNPELNQICENLKDLKEQKIKVDKMKSDARKELDAYSKDIFPQYQKSLNQYLERFGSTFTVAEKTSTHVGGKPSTSFKLVINETPFDIGDRTSPEDVPSFRNTLSEGEKSTLAFCYFLAHLSQDTGIHEKIIVLDDPLSSFDSYRRDITKQEIKRLSEKVKQIVVLSHDQYFLKLIWDDAKNTSKTLCINRAGTSSAFNDWDIEAATQSSYFKDCSKLHRFLENGSSSDSEMRDIARSIRPVLEHNLQVRCPSAFLQGNLWLGQYLEKIKDSDQNDPAHFLKPQYDDLDDINNFSKKYHHTMNANADSEPINPTSLEMYIRKTFK